MILCFEPTFIGREHVPFNSGMLQTIARAFPGDEIRIHAAPAHLAELQADAAVTAHPNIVLRENSEPLYRTADPKRLRPFLLTARIVRNLQAALADVPTGERCLVVLLSSTNSAFFAASVFAWRHAARLAGVQIVLHSNLNHLILEWWRGPLRRLGCSLGLLTAHPLVSYLVVEPEIKQALARIAPAAARRTDALPHPANPNEFMHDAMRPLAEPLRIGFLGRPIGSRGRDLFLELARRCEQKFGARLAFVFASTFRREKGALNTDCTPRPDYLAGLAALHYVLLPLPLAHYTLVGSGALIDALTLRKPVIVSGTPYAKHLFEEFGDIGFLCETEDQFEAALDSVMTLDGARYARQIEALDRARLARAPDSLAPRYGAIVRSRFGIERAASAVPVPGLG